VIQTRFKVVDGTVTEVTILSGPQVYHEEVIKALKKYKCVSTPEETYMTQDFNFQVEDKTERVNAAVRYATIPNGPISRIIKNQKINLNKYSVNPKEGSPDIAIPSCRLGTKGVVDLQGKSPAEFISDAINLELIEAGQFSPQFFLTISIDSLDFSSALSGNWSFKASITNPFGATIKVEEQFKFSTTLEKAVTSCNNGTSAFIPAVRELIAKILLNIDTRRLIPEKIQLN
jgi:hypothetical protein